MKRRTTALIAALVMIMTLIPVSASAAPSGIAVTNAAGLRRVLTNAAGGSYYLAADIGSFSGSPVKVSGGKYVLDLNGHRISGRTDNGREPMILVLGGELTVKDSAGGGGMTYVSAADKNYADPIGADSGILNITGGSFKGAYGTWCEGGTVNISGGTFTGDYYGAIVHGGTMNISGGTFSVDSNEDETAAVACIPHDEKGTLTVSGGIFKAAGGAHANALNVSGGSCTVNEGSFTSQNGEAAVHFGGALKINGGSFSGASYGLLCEERYGDPVLTLKGGKFTGTEAGLASFEENVTYGDYVLTPSDLSEETADGKTLFLSGTSVSVVMGDGSAKRSYRAGQFRDVDESKWYGVDGAKTVAGVWNNRLMDGMSEDRFGVGSPLTIAQALAVADKIHCEYETGAPMPAGSASGSKWYQYFADYAIEQGIIKAGEFSDYEAFATRAEMVHIFAHCLPESEFAALVPLDSLPDVKQSDKYGSEIFMFYRAGILTGSDNAGSFRPGDRIVREEAAAIFLHVYDKDSRSVADWLCGLPKYEGGVK